MTPPAGPRREQPTKERTSPAQPPETMPTARGAQRRLRALAARAWSPQAIEQQTGIPAPLLSRSLARRDDITPRLAQAIGVVYEQLWDQDPPTDTVADRDAAERMALHAAYRGWAPPLAWDDDQIDIPDARPAQGWKPRKRTTKRAVDLVEDAEFVKKNDGYKDASVAEVALRLGVSRDCLEQAYVRARRYAAHNAEAEAG
jgi:hypothetical protein